jgi:hypothetical protein
VEIFQLYSLILQENSARIAPQTERNIMERLNFFKCHTSQLSQDLNQLNAEFVAFNKDCIFLSDSFGAMLADECHSSDSTTKGLQSFSEWVKPRTANFTQDLSEINKRCSAK